MKEAWNKWPANLQVLLEERLAFVKAGVGLGGRVLELGSGRGHTRRFLDGVQLVQTDVEKNDWLDVVTSAETLPFLAGSFDAVVFVAVLHHLDYPLRAMDEAIRVLRVGGRIFLSEPHGSHVLRFLLRFLKHEHFDAGVNPYSGERCKSNSRSSWDGNNAIVDLIFEDQGRFKERFPDLRLDHFRYCECLLFINSGGVNKRTPYIPLPRLLLRNVARVDRFLVDRWPHLFGLGQEVVLTKLR